VLCWQHSICQSMMFDVRPRWWLHGSIYLSIHHAAIFGKWCLPYKLL